MSHTSSKSKMKFFAILILILLLASTNLCGSIIGDKENRILVNQPNKDVIGQTFQFRFQLSTQLYTKQYIAVKFPDLFSGNLGFDRPNRFACELLDITNSVQIPTQSTLSTTPDINTAFCQLTQNTIVLNPGISYQLSLVLSGVKLSTSNYINNVSIFTATDSSPLRLIIDSSNFFGQIGLYSDWTGKVKTALSIVSTSVVSPKALKIYGVFDLSVTFIANSFIPKDSVILFKWPSQYIYRPHSCSNLKIVDGDHNRAALNGNIFCTILPGTIDTFVLNGLMDDLTALRQFKIIFRNFQAMDQATTTNQNFQVMAYYKNSYSILGYDSSPVFKIGLAGVTSLSVSHPDNLNIYANAAWPLVVSFSIDTTLPNGGYVLLQLQNYSSTNKLNFVASTCDFSNNVSSVSEYFGQRPVCSPLGPYSVNSDISGNGMFFKLDSIWAGLTYNINVFAFAEACGLTTLSQSQTSFVNFQFVLTVYKDIDMTQLNENRLIYQSNTIFAQSLPIVSQNLQCFNNVQLVTATNPNALYLSQSGGSSIDNIMYNELHNFSFSYFPTPSCSDSGSCYLSDISNNNSPYTQSYIETDDSTRSVAGSYFNIRADVPFGIQTNPLMRHLIPIPVFIDPVFLQIQKQSGSLQLHFNSAWLTPGDVGNCYASWGAVWEQQNADFSYSSLSTPAASQTVLNDITDSINLNFISQVDSTIDSQSFSPPYNINSVEDKTGFTKFKFLEDREVQCNSSGQCDSLNFSVFSTCFKFANPMPNILSQYAYFDFQFNFYYSSSSAVNRVNRFFKFVNNAVGFLDINKVSTQEGSSIFTYHYSIFPNSDNNNAICLLEIYQTALLANLDNAANTLIIYLNNLMPLDVDYSNVSSTYPALPNGDLSGVYMFPTRKLNSNLSLFMNRQELYQTAYYTNYISTYYTYLSPYIMFTNTGKNILNQNVFIPTYCPSSNNFSFSAVWYQGNVDSFSNIKKVSMSIAMKDPTNALVTRFQIQNLAGNKTPLTLTTIYNTSVFLPRYSPADTNDKIYFNNNSNNMNCSGYSLLLNGINLTAGVQNTLSLNGNVLQGYTYTSQYMFYAFRKKFNTFIFSTNNSSIQVPKEAALNLNYYFTGIQRPTLDMFVDSSGNPNINDKIAFFCASNVLTESGLLSNLNRINLDYSFQIEFNLDSTTTWPKINISRDNNDVNYTQDPTSNIIVQLQTPLRLTTNILIYMRLNTNNFSNNSICTMIFASYNVDCKILNYKTYERTDQVYTQCPVPIVTDTFTIACYNIVMNSATLVVDNITVSINDNYMMQAENANDSRLTFVNPNYQTNYPLTNDFAYVSDFSYEYSNQLYSFVKGIFTIQLPRGIVRGSQLIIQGNFSNFFSNNALIQNFSIISHLPLSCSVLIGNSQDISNIFVDSCDLTSAVSNLWHPTQLITVSFKNFIYEPNINLSSILYISIYPIIALDLNPLQVSTSFTVSWVLPGNVPIAKSTQSPLSWTNSNFFNSFTPIYQDFLCAVSRVYPIITNEETRMNFVFDLETNWNSIISNPAMKGYTPNEFLVHFDNLYFSLGDIIVCSTENSIMKLNCSKIGDNILSIRIFGNTLKNFKYDIEVTGIIIGSNFKNLKNNYKFLCSINNVDISGNRLSLLNGLGIIYQTFTEPKLNGGLMIYDITTPNLIIRSNSSSIFTFGFDRTNSLTALPNILEGNPYFLVIFPTDYPLVNFYEEGLVCNMNLFNSTSASARYPSSTGLSVQGCRLYGANSILVNMAGNSIIIPPTFRYFELTISNIFNPVEPLLSVGTFKIVISNDSYDYLYRSYSSLSKCYNNLLPNPLDSFINYYRGFSYTQSQSLLKLDVIDTNNNNSINYLTIKPGRYQIFSLSFDKINYNIPYEETEVQLNDGNFRIYETHLRVNTYQASVDFHVGTSCTTANGVYYTYLSLPTSNYFHAYIPITIVVQGTYGSITISVPSNIEKGINVPIPITLSELNYDYINVNFNANVNNNLNNLMPSSVVIPPLTPTMYATYTTAILAANSNDNFIVSTDSKCFNLANNSVLFNVNKSFTASSNAALTKTNFVYTGQYAQVSGKNSIWLDFIPPVDSGVINCALLCYLADYLSDEEIIKANIANTPLLSLFSSSFSSSSPTIIKFDNLIRGQVYKLKCVLQYKQSQVVSYSVEDITIDQFATYIQTSDNTLTSCVEFNFLSQIDTTLMTKVLNYCQDIYRDIGGCIVCADNYGNLPDGEQFSLTTQCSSSINDSRSASYRIYNSGTYLDSNYKPLYFDNIISMTTSNINVNSSIYSLEYPVTFPYLVCAIQDKICSNDLADSVLNQSINSLQYNLSNEYMFYNTLGIHGVNLINSNLRTDIRKPVINTLSSYIIGDPYIDTSGKFNIKINFNIPLLCYWKLDVQNSTYTQFEILMCTDTTKCGYTRINQIAADIYPFSTAKLSLGNYTLYMFCYNDVPNPSNASDVIGFYLFDLNSAPGIEPSDFGVAAGST